jgi:YjbE family integral membrane protein
MVGLAGQNFSDLWGSGFHANFEAMGHGTFWIAVVEIIFINLLLSADNAVVIALACRGLPPRQRLWGLIIGISASVTLLIVFAGLVTELMVLPYVKIAGGIALLYIATKLLVPEPADHDEVEVVAHLWRAVRIVLVADLIMSFDNVLALAAIAKGNVVLLAAGLAICIPVVIGGAALIIAILDRAPILIWAGAAFLGWVAGELIATDPVTLRLLSRTVSESTVGWIELAASAAGAALVLAVGGFWRYRRFANELAETADKKLSDKY